MPVHSSRGFLRLLVAARRPGRVPTPIPRAPPAPSPSRPTGTARPSPTRKPSGVFAIQGRRPRHGPASFSSWSRLRSGGELLVHAVHVGPVEARDVVGGRNGLRVEELGQLV